MEQENRPRQLADLCKRSRDLSLEKGWLNEDGTDPRPFHTVTSLFHSELSEAFEEVRDHKAPNVIYYEVKIKEDDGSTSKSLASADQLPSLQKLESKYGRGREFIDAKPCGIPIEFADFVIRVAQYYGSAGKGAELARQVHNQPYKLTEYPSVEELIADLHSNVSMAYVISNLVKAGHTDALDIAGFSENPMHYHATALYVLFSYCAQHEIDLWGAIEEKEDYNKTRPVRHGGKKM